MAVSVTSATRSYRGVSAEQRRAQRREALLTAALDLISEGGAKAVTKRSVCVHARLNDRYFYEHFADSSALLSALIEQHTAQGIQISVAAVLDSGSRELDQVVRAVADAGLTFLESDPRRQALILASYDIDALSGARQKAQHAIANAMAAFARRPHDADGASVDLDMKAYLAVGGTLELIAAWLRGDFPTNRDRILEVIASALAAASPRVGAD